MSISRRIVLLPVAFLAGPAAVAQESATLVPYTSGGQGFATVAGPR
jgi:hypothetical protein